MNIEADSGGLITRRKKLASWPVSAFEFFRNIGQQEPVTMDIEQVVEVCRHWQKPASWYMLFEVSAFRREAVREYLKDNTPETQSRLNRSSEILNRHTDSLYAPGNWIRLNRPDLIVEIPILDWTAQEREHIHEYCQKMQRIEAGILSSTVIPDLDEPKAETPKTKRRTKPRMPQPKVEAHWQAVMGSGNRDLIHEYLTLGEIALAEKIGTSRNTLRAVEAFQKRDIALREFNRQNR